ncbi:MAG: FAD-dependent oxidoreductase [Dehalococcoidia bacterium]|nr:FAD-dependent oxidoreductase [Dehalococcoidia bacterium]
MGRERCLQGWHTSEPRHEVSLPDVVIIGGGVIGCAAGYELACAGMKVTVVERDGIASHASGYSYGGLYPTWGAGIPGPVLEPAKQALDLHIELYPRLKAETGIDFELRQVESIALAADEAGLPALQKDCDWQISQGFDAETLSSRDVYGMEPSLAPGLAGGLLQRTHYELDSYKFTAALARGIEKHGGNIVRADVMALAGSRDCVTGVKTRTGSVMGGGAVVMATGPWAGSTPEAAPARESSALPLPSLPVKAVKGEILRMRLPGMDFHHRCGMYGRNVGRKPDGLVWIGTTEVVDNFDEQTTAEGRDFIFSGALKYAPKLADAELVQQTACLRPVAVDGLPIVGPLGSVEGLFAAVAAGKKGVLLSLVMAKWTSALVLGKRDAWPLPPELSTARFGL